MRTSKFLNNVMHLAIQAALSGALNESMIMSNKSSINQKIVGICSNSVAVITKGPNSIFIYRYGQTLSML